MSYCRFIEGDVYAYACDGGVQFYVSDGKRELDRLCGTFNEAYQYARELRDTHRLDVPSHAIEALKADALEEAARICGPDSAVAELEAENEKLREYAMSYAKAVECEGCGWCPYDINDVCDTETMPMRDGCKLYDELRELGIEVDE